MVKLLRIRMWTIRLNSVLGAFDLRMEKFRCLSKVALVQKFVKENKWFKNGFKKTYCRKIEYMSNKKKKTDAPRMKVVHNRDQDRHTTGNIIKHTDKCHNKKDVPFAHLVLLEMNCFWVYLTMYNWICIITSSTCTTFNCILL